MADFTRPATWDDLKHVAQLLNEAGVRYALIGGYPIAAHGYNRFSEDLDILVDPARENTAKWIGALSRLPDGACKELAGQDDLFQSEGEYAVRINDEFTIAVMPAACGHRFQELAGFIELRDLDGVQLPLMGLAGLFLTKEGMREKDRADRKEVSMSSHPIHTIDSAPEQSKPLLRALKESFGFLPNIAGAMAASPTLLDTFVGVFQKVHAGSFSEAQIQTVLLTNAVTNASEWPIAFHSALALRAGIAPLDVAALRERRAPSDPKLAALSSLARAMIEKRGHIEEQELMAFHDAGFAPELALELLTITAASTMTNYVANIAKPPLEAAFQPHAWSE